MSAQDKIAIIGMSYRLPGGTGLPFWRKLVGGEDLVTEVEEGRWAKRKFLHPRKSEPGCSYTFAAGSIADALKFDAAFFGISPREAAQMDPQQRLLMLLAWEALEAAGVKPSSLRGSNCGVFIGLSSYDYVHRLANDLAAIDAKTPTGNAGSIAANRISYFLDLHGPSLPVDTACSSSLAAFHQAWNAMRLGECDTALVGGVSLHFHPMGFISFTKTGMLSPDGRCRTFDAAANGYVRSEGAGMVVLKTLDRAMKDGDRILAVVEGSGLNCDGKTNGITVPSGEAQAALLDQVYRQSGIDPADLDFLEAHGTGTALGDPIETWAIGQVLGQRRPANAPLPIGSVKSNLGHLEAASGMAGLVKVLLMFQQRVIPPNLHFQEPNPRIDFEALNLRVVTKPTALSPEKRLLTGINSFGFGGANAHLILSAPEQSAPKRKSAPPRTDLPFIYSAKTTPALRQMAANLADFVETHHDVPLYDIAWTLHHRRESLPKRALFRTKDRDALIQALRQHALGDPASPVIEANALPSGTSRPVFVFTGNGAQWAGMGQQLFAECAEFRRAIEGVDEIFRQMAPFSLLPHFAGEGAAVAMEKTEIAQPLIFAIQVALVHVLRERELKPGAVIGHSLGEIAAAWACGALDLEQAVRVIRLRSSHQQTSEGTGGLTAVSAPRHELEALLAEPALDGLDVVVSGENSPRTVTVAGSNEGLVALEKALTERGLKFKRLDLAYPFHSPLMDEVTPGFLEELGELFADEPRVPFYSTVTGARYTAAPGSSYWGKNIRHPVLFREAVEACAEDGHRVFLEIGPHPVLTSHIWQTLQARRWEGYATEVASREACSLHNLCQITEKLLLGGGDDDWARHFKRCPALFPDLPAYPWQAEEFPLPSTVEGGGLVAAELQHPLLGTRLTAQPWEWESNLDTSKLAWLCDHQVGGSVVFPAAGFIEMGLAAGRLRHPDQAVQLEDFEIRSPLVLDARKAKTVRFALEEHTGRFVIKSRDRLSDGPWQPHVTGQIVAHPSKRSPSQPPPGSDEETIELTAKQIYAAAERLGLVYGPAFQTVRDASVQGPEIHANLTLPGPTESGSRGFEIHPTLLDGALQSLLTLVDLPGTSRLNQALLPVRVERFYQRGQAGPVSTSRAIIRHHGSRSLLADFYLTDASGLLVGAAIGVRFRAAVLKKPSFERAKTLTQQWVRRPRTREYSAFEHSASLVRETLAGELAALPDHHVLRRYPVEGDCLVDALCSAYALASLREMADEEGRLSLAVAQMNGHVAPGMEDYLTRLATMLVEDGLAAETEHPECWQLVANADVPAASEIWRSLMGDFPDKSGRLALVGRVGLHLREILDGSRHIEDLLPKLNKLSSGGFAFHKSGVKREMQQLIAGALAEAIRKCEAPPRQILWVTGARPADEVFLAPWMQDHPGLVTVLLPDAAETLDVESRLSAYPGVRVVRGAVDQQTLQTLTAEHGEFDLVVAPPGLTEEQYKLLSTGLLRGGILLACVPEKSRFTDFIPALDENSWEDIHKTPETLRSVFGDLAQAFLSPAGSSGPSIAVASRAGTVDTSTSKNVEQALIIPLDTTLIPLAEQLLDALSTGVTATVEGLPPHDDETTEIWTKVLSDLLPSRLILLASAPDEKNPRATAADLADQMCAISSCLQTASKIAPHLPIILVTRGAFSGAASASWMTSSFWGFARVARNEFGNLKIRCLDLGSDDPSPAELESLAQEILSNDDEEEVQLLPQQRLVQRVIAEGDAERSPLADNERMVLDFETPGPFQNLRWQRHPKPAPRAGEICIETRAAGLNFRDVMYAMGLLPDEALEGGFAGPTLGMECSGIVRAVGPGVVDYRPGDEVIAFAPASFSSHAITSVAAVIPKPPGISFAAAATIPAAFYTAYHALIELGQLQPGERVLIHGAAGGVGIAAMQIARHVGAEVFATAGSEEKRDFVRLLGADHVFHSRSLDFADEILDATGGEGIDVVLNSLAGAAVTRNLEILRPFGRLLELGKRDFYENNRIGLRPFRHNIRYFAVDADQIMALRPDMAARGFQRLLELFREGILVPLPLTVFPASEAAEAFRYMQHSNQTGKVVLDLSDIPGSPTKRPSGTVALQTEGTYLVTGGLSGFGLETARWLVARGARTLALLGRRGAVEPEALAFIESCREKGITVLTEPCNVADATSLSATLEKIRRELPPLRGVFHAATVIDDALILNLEAKKAETVLAPKVTGAALLDRLTREDHLDHFVLYSSATTLFGNPGQSIYVAANTALEQLAAKRRREGLAATCISWGPIGDTGYLSRNEKIKEALATRTGGQPLQSADALRFLDQMLASDGSQVAWMDLDWGSLARFLPSAQRPRFDMLRHWQTSSGHSAEGATDLLRELQQMDRNELLASLCTLLKEEIGGILRIDPLSLDDERSLLEIGMDSLMGVELMTSLETNLGVSLPLMALGDGPTVARLAERLAQAIQPSSDSQTEPSEGVAAQVRHLAAQHGVQDMSETQIADIASIPETR